MMIRGSLRLNVLFSSREYCFEQNDILIRLIVEDNIAEWIENDYVAN